MRTVATSWSNREEACSDQVSEAGSSWPLAVDEPELLSDCESTNVPEIVSPGVAFPQPPETMNELLSSQELDVSRDPAVFRHWPVCPSLRLLSVNS